MEKKDIICNDKDCANCKHCEIASPGSFQFPVCTHPPFNGRWCKEIKPTECPKFEFKAPKEIKVLETEHLGIFDNPVECSNCTHKRVCFFKSFIVHPCRNYEHEYTGINWKSVRFNAVYRGYDAEIQFFYLNQKAEMCAKVDEKEVVVARGYRLIGGFYNDVIFYTRNMKERRWWVHRDCHYCGLIFFPTGDENTFIGVLYQDGGF